MTFGPCFIRYMFSLYGPQFAEKLHYTQTETSFIAVTGRVYYFKFVIHSFKRSKWLIFNNTHVLNKGDYGMYLSGPLWGWAIDTLGSQK